MLELLYTSAKALTDYPSFMAYVEIWDALAAFIGNKIYKIYRDGTQVYLGDTYISWSKGNRCRGRFFYFSYENSAWCYAAEEITGQICTDQVLNPSWKVPSEPGAFLDDLSRLYAKPGNQVYLYHLDSGVSAGQIALGFSVNNLAYANQHHLMAIKESTGQMALLDYFTREIILSTKVRPCQVSAYDCRHNLIITVETDKLVRIYLLDPVPAILSVPVLTPAAGQCRGSRVRTQLTGDAGEPCPGYRVNLEIVGSPPKGSLQKAAAATGADGYAEHFYFGPGPGEVIGNETLQATVVI